MDLDRLTDAVRKIVDALFGPRLDLLALYPAVAVSQSGNSVDVTPDDTRIPGIQGVPIFSGTPGVTATVPDGTRVLLGFRGGDRRLPYVAMWETVSPRPQESVIDADAIKLGANALKGVARLGDAVQAGPWAGVITSASLTVTAQD